jgi:hypothetical protein
VPGNETGRRRGVRDTVGRRAVMKEVHHVFEAS